MDKDSGRAWHARTEVSYWQGSDGGERWSEGDRARELVFRDIPPGEMKWDGHTTPEKYARLDALKFNQARREALKEMDWAWMDATAETVIDHPKFRADHPKVAKLRKEYSNKP